MTSELLTQLEQFNDDIGSQASAQSLKLFLGKALKGSLVGLAGIASAKLLNDSNIGMETVKELLEDDSDTFRTQLTKDYSEQIEAIKQIRLGLEQLAEVLEINFSASLPVVVLVDELDRCRPTYAIEMLEVIKHFFSTKNFVFVVATDTEQLCHSIKAVYGNDFASLQYLKRFFDRKANLPEPDIEHYLSNKEFNYPDLEIFPYFSYTATNSVNKHLAILAKAYGLQVRDIDQLVNKVDACLRTVEALKRKKNEAQHINIVALIIGLIEQDQGLESYNERSNYITPKSQFVFVNKDIIPGLSLKDCISKSLSCVVLKQGTIKGPFGRDISHHYLPRGDDLGLSQSSSTPEEKHWWIMSLSKNTAAFNEEIPNSKYWLWEDLKGLIELAGKLE
ncbi:P-loop NTPase fold protein [Agarivorans sp. Alg241-V36]|uniref:KAP family P-loop NTPase fold protein n=1 Tax=Agarivorans sp. Alg241-V36 TaxID=2305992 RepID=UPI0021026D0B|nr:P-loop NTPase fold protein [Agarivorans sp. Alg241-V36]